MAKQRTPAQKRATAALVRRNKARSRGRKPAKRRVSARRAAPTRRRSPVARRRTTRKPRTTINTAIRRNLPTLGTLGALAFIAAAARPSSFGITSGTKALGTTVNLTGVRAGAAIGENATILARNLIGGVAKNPGTAIIAATVVLKMFGIKRLGPLSV